MQTVTSADDAATTALKITHPLPGGSATKTETNALGWLSLALGATALCAPLPTARLLGLPVSARSTFTLRAVGVREIGVGLGLLKSQRSDVWTWLRVAGDVMDVSLLLGGLAARRSRRRRLAAAVGVIGAVLAIDAIAAVRRTRNRAVYG
jgi:hypothetical protein